MHSTHWRCFARLSLQADPRSSMTPLFLNAGFCQERIHEAEIRIRILREALHMAGTGDDVQFAQFGRAFVS